MEALGFTKSQRRRFNDAEYILSVAGDTESLSVEVEHAEDGRRWRARFAAGFVEEITRRTGNAKKFDVFVRMLLSALAQESDSVYLDVLTARDLEMLRRHANPEAPPAAPATMQPDKRYMILTYRAEFDKVHYPLPLALDERSEEDVLRAMVARLRSELAQAQEANKAQKPPPPQHFAADDERVSKLHLQNQQLTDSLHAMQKEAEQLRSELRLRTVGQQDHARTEEVSRLKAELTRTKAEVKSLKDELKQRELAQKRSREKEAAELRAERQKADRLQAQLKKLEEEKRTLAARVGRSGPFVERSRPVSRTPSAERARPPSRPLSGSRPASRPPPRPSSRASSAASSRERTPSPSSFLHRGRPASQPRREDSAGRRSPALNSSGSPGFRREEGQRGGRGYSPGPSVSPYRRPAGPGSRSRERTPSPGSQRRVAPPTAVNGRGASALSLRERGGDPGAGVGPKPPSSRYGGTVRPPPAAPEVPNARPHQPGSLFGLAADLGLGGAPTPPEEAEACDIDARLQALQSFLKQTKNIAA